MPIPGPRTQHGPLPGYRNPESREPDLFNLWKRPGPVPWPGRTPGMMVITLRGCVLGAGQIRRLWRQSVNFTPAQSAFSWTDNKPQPGHSNATPAAGFEVTRALRYLTRSLYVGGGIDHTRFDELHTVVRQEHYYKQITVGRGQTRSRPTVRNRLTSFGSRVPTLNHTMSAAQTEDGDG